MITVGQRRQIIQLRTTVVLIPRARRFSKEEKTTGFKQSSHIVWKNRKTHLFRKYSFSSDNSFKTSGEFSRLVVFVTDS